MLFTDAMPKSIKVLDTIATLNETKMKIKLIRDAMCTRRITNSNLIIKQRYNRGYTVVKRSLTSDHIHIHTKREKLDNVSTSIDHHNKWRTYTFQVYLPGVHLCTCV